MASNKGFIPLRPTKLKLKANATSPCSLKQNMPLNLRPSPLTAPIIIRYIDPRLVPLLVQLGKLSQMVETFAHKSARPDNLEEKEELDGLIRSTKDLNSKMSAILQQNEGGFSTLGEGSAKPQQVSSEYKYMGNTECEAEIKSLKEVSVDETDLDSIDMIEVLNKVSSRIEELEEENAKLKAQLELNNYKLQNLNRQKTEPRKSLPSQSDQQQAIEIIRREIEKLTKNQQTIEQCFRKIQHSFDYPKALR